MTDELERRAQDVREEAQIDRALLETRMDFQFQNEDTSWGSVRIQRQSEITYSVARVSKAYNIRRNDRYIICEGTDTFTVTLPRSNVGKVYTIKNRTGTAITIDGNGTNIDSNPSKTISVLFSAVTIVYTGFEWSVVMEI